MKQGFTFEDRGGRKLACILSIGDLQKIAFTLAARARAQGRATVKALDGEIVLTVTEL